MLEEKRGEGTGKRGAGSSGVREKHPREARAAQRSPRGWGKCPGAHDARSSGVSPGARNDCAGEPAEECTPGVATVGCTRPPALSGPGPWGVDVTIRSKTEGPEMGKASEITQVALMATTRPLQEGADARWERGDSAGRAWDNGPKPRMASSHRSWRSE